MTINPIFRMNLIPAQLEGMLAREWKALAESEGHVKRHPMSAKEFNAKKERATRGRGEDFADGNTFKVRKFWRRKNFGSSEQIADATGVPIRNITKVMEPRVRAGEFIRINQNPAAWAKPGWEHIMTVDGKRILFDRFLAENDQFTIHDVNAATHRNESSTRDKMKDLVKRGEFVQFREKPAGWKRVKRDD
jgi:hypothetical protein